MVRGREITIPLEGIVDFAKEVARLDKGIAKADDDVGQLQKRLSNPSFVDRAPPEVVEEVRSKIEAAKMRRDTLARSRERLAAAIQE